MDSRDFIKVGRGHDSEVRITDISVSRCHALIKRSSKGDYVLEDNASKFGTLVQVRKPYMLNKHGVNHFQIGRTLVEAQIKEPKKRCSINDLCFTKKVKVQKGTLAYDGEDFFPVEYIQRPNEHTVEDVNFIKNEKEEKLVNNRSQALKNMTEQL